MRLFVAIELDRAVVEGIAGLSGELRRRVAVQAPRARLTWVPPERLHLTVRFIGEAGERRAAAIAAALEPALDAGVFEIVVEGAGAFPSGGPPRVLWAGIAGGAEALAGVEREVSARLAAGGVPRGEERAHRPHVTLARVREAAGLRSGPLFEGLRAGTLGASRVDAITLFQSRLSSKGPTYVPLQRTPLRLV